MEQTRFFKISFFLLFLVVFLQVTEIFGLFLQPLLWATILALLFYPLFFLLNRISGHRRNLSAFLVTLMVVLCTIGPIVFFSGTLIKEMLHLYQTASQWISGQSYQPWLYWIITSPVGSLWRRIIEKTTALDIEFLPMIGKAAQTITQNMIGQFQSIATNAIGVAINYVLAIVILFFFLRDGHTLGRALKDLFPMSTENKEAVFARLSNTLSAVVQGLVVTGLVQAVLAGLAFWILRVPYPLFLALLTGFLALVPVGGAILVWLPCCLYLFGSGHWVKALILLIWGVLVISMVDNFLKPLLIGEKTKLPTLFLLLSILGGLSYYGFVGIFLGPVMLALFLTLVEIYRKDYHS